MLWILHGLYSYLLNDLLHLLLTGYFLLYIGFLSHLHYQQLNQLKSSLKLVYYYHIYC